MKDSSLKSRIVFDHDDWLLCHKPCGVNFHSEDGIPGFVEIMRSQTSMPLWPVHRLDKATSGLILLAKSQQACADLSKLFADKKIEKFYLSICSNVLKKKQGKVIGDMAKARRGSFKLLKTQENPAVTQFVSKSLIPGFRLCLLKPKTGKTHQLRVMMKSLGSPILGDERYSGPKSDRLYLHAYALRFQYADKNFEFTELPNNGLYFETEEFMSAMGDWGSPWLLNWP